jgi:hypothetical protein
MNQDVPARVEGAQKLGFGPTLPLPPPAPDGGYRGISCPTPVPGAPLSGGEGAAAAAATVRTDRRRAHGRAVGRGCGGGCD